ncbi:hypothetical protein V7S43_014365 [Phytophthora oleae]|uniref:Uncharacterized protein n=1 Tax=Phytophthora oleae TaxID=2107226 RepID=A0ABD3F590_9STRA
MAMTNKGDLNGRGLLEAEPAPTTPARSPLPLLQDIYVDEFVAFSPEKEQWMKARVYRAVEFQHAVEHLSVGVIQNGIKYYRSFGHLKNPDWQVLTQPNSDDNIEIDDVADLEVGEVCEEYKFPEGAVTNLEGGGH